MGSIPYPGFFVIQNYFVNYTVFLPEWEISVNVTM